MAQKSNKKIEWQKIVCSRLPGGTAGVSHCSFRSHEETKAELSRAGGQRVKVSEVVATVGSSVGLPGQTNEPSIWSLYQTLPPPPSIL